MELSAKIMVISGNKKITKLMQAADCFEKSKVIGNLQILNISYKEKEKLTLQRAGKLIDVLKEGLEKDEIVSFVHVIQIQIGGKIIENKGEVIPYINKEVRCISDGHNWFVLAQFIKEKTNLKVVTNNEMFITGVGVDTGLDEIKFESNKIPAK